MAAQAILTSPFLSSPVSKKTSLIISPAKKKTKPSFAIRCSSEEDDHGYSAGRLVDENLTVLRMRIHEMKVIERNYQPPAEWMDWEKKCYTDYDSVICYAVGTLQWLLMDTRPSLALGFTVLLALGLSDSLFLLVSKLMGLTGAIIHFVN